MDLAPYVDRLHHDLATAAEAGGPDARALAERLVAPLDSAVRLVLLESLAAAAGDITRDLAPGSVELRLRGRDPEFHVTPPPPPDEERGPDRDTGRATGGPAAAAPSVDEPGEAEEAATSRVTLRLPEQLKTRAEAAAVRAGLSVNTWLVRTVAAALDAGTDPLRPGGRSPVTSPAGPDGVRSVASSGTRHTGWVR